MSQAEKFEFKSETKELLHLMAHSLYSSKDVFLRELISNASDALDKRRFEALTDKTALGEDEKLEIKVYADKNKRILTVEDNGIGMSRDEMIQNLGTIAHSGTKAFIDRLKDSESKDQIDSLIGQFGVGFYSAFIVASDVHVYSKRLGENVAHCFESKGDGVFTIEECKKDSVGTRIELTLLDEDSENNLLDFTKDYILRQTIKKYSDFVQYPIMLEVEKSQHVACDDPDHDVNACTEPSHQEVVLEWEQANSMKAIWLRNASDVTDEEYNEFYKHITHDWSDPLIRIPVKAEGTREYHALLFIPSRPPFDLYYRDAKFGLRLHAQHVLIMEQCEELIPDYLRFVKGVVDSADLNLNLSREILQKDHTISAIRKHLTKKILDALEKLALNEGEKYAEFWNHYSRLLKMGAADDFDNRERILKLLRFVSTFTVNEDAKKAETDMENEEQDEETKQHQNLVSFDQYIDRMKPGQDAIYVISGETLETLKKSPHLEAFLQKEYEVLFLTDQYDEYLFTTVTEYKGKSIKFVGRGEVELGTEEEKKEQRDKVEEQKKEFDDLMKAIEKALPNEVSSVRISTRLTNSPACLVGMEGDVSPHFHKMIAQMTNSEMPQIKRILEINPNHPLLKKLQAKFNEDHNFAALPKFATLLYGQSLLAEGSSLPDPIEYTKLVTELMVDQL